MTSIQPGDNLEFTNRLSRESSPYLLQHQHNPVDWYPWGAEAFEAARKEDKPIFLSVGYSTCYWCHVMERQSFENEAVAAEMNRLFINIKVDREERPDVDQLYMTAVQVLTRQGGWPMSVFLTPELLPFYGGTYFPPTDSYGRPGFVTLLRGINDAYRNRRSEVRQTTHQLVQILQRLSKPAAPRAPIQVNHEWLKSLIMRSVADYDPRHGGFGAAPKFPRETLLELLLVFLDSVDTEDAQTQDRARLADMIFHTLDALAAGGIHDHLGGGFHRYSTDAEWLVPHFEIMLYDNAMLAWCYAEAFRQSKRQTYAHVARGILDFVLREMTSPEGAFYTAFDAEVDAREGLSYLWTPGEVQSVLNAQGGDDAATFNEVYGLSRGANFVDPHHGSGTPDRNILFLPRPIEAVAHESEISPGDLESRLAVMRQKLYAARRQRKQPMLDNKILTSWNALMIRALAHAGKVLDEHHYVAAAERAARFLLDRHRTSDGGMTRTSGGGMGASADDRHRPPIPGFLDDYSFLAQALLALHQTNVAAGWRERAEEVVSQMEKRFGDPQDGGYFFADRNGSEFVIRQTTAADSPLPSGNAVAAMALLELGETARARKTLATFAQQTEDFGEAMSSMIEAGLLYLRKAEPFTVGAGIDASESDRPLSPQQLAAGIVDASARWENESELRVCLHIRSGYHINGHEVGTDEPLIPTRLIGLESRADVKIFYPKAQEQRMPFSDKPFRVYSGKVEIVARFDPPPWEGRALQLSVSFQPCDDRSCLPPVTKPVRIIQ